MLDANGVRILVDFLNLAHLHVTRAHIPTQTNVIEASEDQLTGAAEKEWYFGNKEKERLGPYSFQEVGCERVILFSYSFLFFFILGGSSTLLSNML